MSHLFASDGQSIGVSASKSVLPNEHSGLISFRMDWLDLLAVQGTLKSLLQHHSSKASILDFSAFLIVQLSHPYMTTGKTIALTRWTFVGKVMSLLFNMLSRLVVTFLPRSKHPVVTPPNYPIIIMELEKDKKLRAGSYLPFSHPFRGFQLCGQASPQDLCVYVCVLETERSHGNAWVRRVRTCLLWAQEMEHLLGSIIIHHPLSSGGLVWRTSCVALGLTWQLPRFGSGFLPIRGGICSSSAIARWFHAYLWGRIRAFSLSRSLRWAAGFSAWRAHYGASTWFPWRTLRDPFRDLRDHFHLWDLWTSRNLFFGLKFVCLSCVLVVDALRIVMS